MDNIAILLSANAKLSYINAHTLNFAQVLFPGPYKNCKTQKSAEGVYSSANITLRQFCKIAHENSIPVKIDAHFAH